MQFKMSLQLIPEFTPYVSVMNLVFCIKKHLASPKEVVDER